MLQIKQVQKYSPNGMIWYGMYIFDLSVAQSEWTRQNVERIVDEAYSVGNLEGIDFEGLSRQEMVEYVLQVARNTGGNVCSMLADLRKGSRTETDAINGKIVRLLKWDTNTGLMHHVMRLFMR